MIVSRETQEKFQIYEKLVKEWNGRSRLVQENTIIDFQDRHIKDSAQIFPLLNSRSTPLLDMGSGAGFPGLVLALLGHTNVSLCESNHKKCHFLELVSRETGAKVNVLCTRVESISTSYDTITSRAMTSLIALLSHSILVSRETSEFVFLKGKSHKEEIDQALEKFDFLYELFPSQTSKDGCIIKIKDLKVREK